MPDFYLGAENLNLGSYVPNTLPDEPSPQKPTFFFNLLRVLLRSWLEGLLKQGNITACSVEVRETRKLAV